MEGNGYKTKQSSLLLYVFIVYKIGSVIVVY